MNKTPRYSGSASSLATDNREATKDEGRRTRVAIRPSSFVLRRLFAKLGPPALFLLLSAIFLWQPILSGQVFLPTDVGYQVDPLWAGQAANHGARTSQNYLLSDVAYY